MATSMTKEHIVSFPSPVHFEGVKMSYCCLTRPTEMPAFTVRWRIR